ncbi:unnamed protein product [Phytophthora fragariaefolia]|uniref:Unnamed protein product n=1 Tax=Phytophthora fragariaefolia TaxID=1490495 RepID=A0A9W7CX29_9STRA|nr:unnamed protein product [Phytophthora fragariaefolia]
MLQPAYPTTKLRAKTADEVAAIVMILNHEIEVPMVPPFRTQSMTPGELAVFEEIFKALEYPIYAHLAPGQRFFDSMQKGVVLAQIYAAEEAAPAHKQKNDQKRDVKNRHRHEDAGDQDHLQRGVTAAKWVGWQMPLASRLLPLINYESAQERSKRTHELVMLDFFSFEVEVNKGELSSTCMYRLLPEGLGLNVPALTHTTTALSGILETQWQVRAQSVGYPIRIHGKGYVTTGRWK